MIIDDISYALPLDNYIQIESIKKQIVIGHTGNKDMRHVIGWLHRFNKKYKKTAAFTIDKAGIIYQHFDPKFQSRFFNDVDLDNKSIVILLENQGWLEKDVIKNEFITWIGDIYKQSSDIVDKKWRGYTYWSSYTEEQVISTKILIEMLCKEFFIPINPITHNTKIDNTLEEASIIYRSNLNKNYTDLSPAWDCNLFKEQLELK